MLLLPNIPLSLLILLPTHTLFSAPLVIPLPFPVVYGLNQSWQMPTVASAVGATAAGVMTVTVAFSSFDGPLVVKSLPYQQVCPTNEVCMLCVW